MKSLLADLDILMVVAGFNGVDEFDRSILVIGIRRRVLILLLHRAYLTMQDIMLYTHFFTRDTQLQGKQYIDR